MLPLLLQLLQQLQFLYKQKLHTFLPFLVKQNSIVAKMTKIIKTIVNIPLENSIAKVYVTNDAK